MSTRSIRYSSLNLHTPKSRMLSGTDQDACKFLEAAGIYDSLQQKAIFNLVYDLKRFGLWSKMKAIYPFVGGTATTHKWNLKDPRDTDGAFRLMFNGGWTHSSTGVMPNGTSGYAVTYWNTTNNGSATNGHYSIYSRTDNKQNSADIGSAQDSNGGGNSYTYMLQFTSSVFVRDSRWCESTNSNTRKTNPLRTDGHIIGSRTSINLAKSYYNGSVEVTNTTTEQGRASTRNFILGAYQLNGGTPGFYSSREYAFASIGDGLTDTEAANLYNAVQRYQQALGRAVGADADASAFITAAGITDYTQQQAIQKLVVDLKSFGLWTKMKAIYPFVGGTASSHKWNLKDPRDVDAAFRLTFSGGWTHSATGAKGNGTNTYADTFLTPSTILTNDSNSLSYYSGSLVAETSADPVNMGSFAGATSCLLVLCKTLPSVSSTYRANGSPLQYFGGDQSGLYLVSKQSSNVTDGYRNGTEVVTGNSGGTLPNVRIYIGNTTLITNTPYSSGYVFNDFRFATIGDGLTDTEAANLYNVVQRFQTDLGRQV